MAVVRKLVFQIFLKEINKIEIDPEDFIDCISVDGFKRETIVKADENDWIKIRVNYIVNENIKPKDITYKLRRIVERESDRLYLYSQEERIKLKGKPLYREVISDGKKTRIVKLKPAVASATLLPIKVLIDGEQVKESEVKKINLPLPTLDWGKSKAFEEQVKLFKLACEQRNILVKVILLKEIVEKEDIEKFKRGEFKKLIVGLRHLIAHYGEEKRPKSGEAKYAANKIFKKEKFPETQSELDMIDSKIEEVIENCKKLLKEKMKYLKN